MSGGVLCMARLGEGRAALLGLSVLWTPPAGAAATRNPVEGCLCGTASVAHARQ